MFSVITAITAWLKVLTPMYSKLSIFQECTAMLLRGHGGGPHLQELHSAMDTVGTLLPCCFWHPIPRPAQTSTTLRPDFPGLESLP